MSIRTVRVVPYRIIGYINIIYGSHCVYTRLHRREVKLPQYTIQSSLFLTTSTDGKPRFPRYPWKKRECAVGLL